MKGVDCNQVVKEHIKALNEVRGDAVRLRDQILMMEPQYNERKVCLHCCSFSSMLCRRVYTYETNGHSTGCMFCSHRTSDRVLHYFFDYADVLKRLQMLSERRELCFGLKYLVNPVEVRCE